MTTREELPPIDFDDLHTRCAGNERLIDKILRIFHERVEADFAKMEQAISEGATHAVELTHALKGAAGNVSAAGLHAVLIELERAVEAAEQQRIDTLLGEARTELQRCRSALDERFG